MTKHAGLFKTVAGEAPDPEARETPADQTAASLWDTPFTLLFVDDEEMILRALRRLFLDEDYKILTATNGDEALAIMAKEPVHLMISDHHMPGMNGAQLLRMVKDRWPETIRIMLTGYADVQSIMGAVNEGAVFKFITKPWQDEDLRLTVSLALQQYVLIQENKRLRELTKKQRDKISKYSAMLDEHKSVLASYLLQDGVVTKEALSGALAKAQAGELPGETLVRLGLLSETKIITTLQRHLRCDYVDLREVEVVKETVKFLPRDLCERNRLLPIRIDNRRLTLAMADPSDMMKIDNIVNLTSLQVVPVIARSTDILTRLQQVYDGGVAGELVDLESLANLDTEPIDEIDIVIEEDEELFNLDELIGSAKVPSIIRIVNAIISEAIRYQASDIHIEPKTKCSVIRFRIDGMIHNKIQIPTDLHPAVVSRIKILAKMDIAERRLPQDGRITVKSGTRLVDLRVATMPTINGEKVVLRVLDKSAALRPLEDLGILAADLAKIRTLAKRPQGIVIATGPTGSGKTTMLYSLLSSMLESTKNFQTIEDPVEYFVEEANQIFIKDKTGLSFSSVLRATMRQDPDVILVGEIRDFETADVAFKAALTGHMVLTTLHTNNSVASITRLIDMGVRPYLIASAIEGILAQRLVRSICRHCRRQEEPSPELLELLKIGPQILPGPVHKGTGCAKCGGTGYLGRAGLFEFFLMNDDFRQAISTDYKEGELIAMARSGGMTTLLEDGIEKVRLGETTLEEILRVLGSQTRYERQCSKCGRRIEASFLFCPFCGEFRKNFCQQCKMPLEKDWLVCPACGRRKEGGR